MSVTIKTWLTLGAIVAGAIVLRDLFPKPRIVQGVPTIVTQHDTVAKIDTQVVFKQIAKLHTDTVYLERVVVSKPETIAVVPPLSGVYGFKVGQNIGDTSYALAFHVEPSGSQYLYSNRVYAFYTPGPLAGFRFYGDTLRAAFYPAPGPSCGLFCKAKYIGEGSLLGIVLYSLLRGH